jgi:6-phosphogluconolactonase
MIHNQNTIRRCYYCLVAVTLLCGSVFVATAQSDKKEKTDMKHKVYLSIAGENKISIYNMNPETGKLQLQEDVVLDGGPGPLAVDPGGKFLYAGVRSNREISSFRIDQQTGGLSLTGTVSLEADPCYIATDNTGNFLLSAYYGAGAIAVHPIDQAGALGGPAIEWITTAPKAHCVLTDRSNKYAFLPHVDESNAIFQFLFDENTGALTPNAVPKVMGGENQGPRHFCFHPTKDFVYTSDEPGSSATAYKLDPSNGTLSPLQTISTLPEGYDESNTCSQVHITPNGRFLYVSNRGHDSIAGFSIDDTTGLLTAIGQQPTEPTPRVFNLDPTGNFLFAGGQGSGKLATYRINSATGVLEPLETYTVGANPMWVLFIILND